MSSDLHFSGKITQKAIIVKDNKVLLVREARYDQQWELPGGRLHNEESLSAGFHREIQEELGIEVVDERLYYSEQFREVHTGNWRLLIAYTCRLKDSDQRIAPSRDEVSEWRWISATDLKDLPIYANSVRALQYYFSIISHSK